MEDQTAIFLLNLGGPDSIEAIRPFLVRLFSDRAMIRIGPSALLQKIIARFIAAKRAEKVAPRYEQIGGKSPINAITAAQADALEKSLNGDGGTHYRVFPVMRYCPPDAEDAMRRLCEEKFKRLIVLPLYPQYSETTTGSHLRGLQRTLKRCAPTIRVFEKKWFYDDAGYLDALSSTVREAMQQLPENLRGGAQILFSAHAIPQALVDSGDPYQRQTEETAKAVAERLLLPENRWTLAYQSRSGPVRWIRPDTETVLRATAAGRNRAVAMVPISFVSDHVETLWEMDIYFRGIAKECGAAFVRAPALNTRPDFITALAGMVRNAEREAE